MDFKLIRRLLWQRKRIVYSVEITENAISRKCRSATVIVKFQGASDEFIEALNRFYIVERKNNSD